jgi:hypothetical protein
VQRAGAVRGLHLTDDDEDESSEPPELSESEEHVSATKDSAVRQAYGKPYSVTHSAVSQRTHLGLW